MQSRWSLWIQEPIALSEAGLTPVVRSDAIRQLCEEGLLPLLRSSGYILRISPRELCRQVLLVVYALSEGRTVLPNSRDEEPYAADQYQEYCQRLDSQAWDLLWEQWGALQDFQEHRRTSKVRYLLPELLWSWMDLERSPTAVSLVKSLEEQEAHEEATKGKEDPYLLETARREYLDKHWH